MSHAQEEPLSMRFIALATSAARRCETAPPDAAHAYAYAALALMQSAALAFQHERIPDSREDGDEHLAQEAQDYRSLLASLEQQFRNAASETSLRVANRIKAVLDSHKQQ